MALHVIVLAGGSGTRLWPLSRRELPKHLLPLGPGGVPLLVATVQRVLPLTSRVHVVTAADQADACRRALGAGGVEVDVIEEPVARGTGPALALATALVAHDDPEAVICSVHADHHVGDDDAYRAATLAAAGWADATGGMATVGITPTSPATGFGYIEIGRQHPAGTWRQPRGSVDETGGDGGSLPHSAGSLPAHQVLSFTEKPSEEVARRLLSGGRHLWNLGLFAWSAPAFRRELEGADPGLAVSVLAVAGAVVRGDADGAHRGYEALATVAVEPLLMERSTALTVVQAAFAWSDLGSWPDIHSARLGEGHGDDDGNVTEGEGVALGSTNCLVAANGGRLVAVVGAEGMIVVDTGDAVLVVPAAHAQRVRELTDRLPALGRADLR